MEEGRSEAGEGQQWEALVGAREKGKEECNVGLRMANEFMFITPKFTLDGA